MNHNDNNDIEAKREESAPLPRRMLSEKQVLEFVPVARSTLYEMVTDGSFPRPIRLRGRRVAWYADEVIKWQRSLERAA